jgi:hypothetical protein
VVLIAWSYFGRSPIEVIYYAKGFRNQMIHTLELRQNGIKEVGKVTRKPVFKVAIIADRTHVGRLSTWSTDRRAIYEQSNRNYFG